MSFTRISPVALLAAILLLAACGRVQEKSLPDLSDQTIQIVATTGMVGDIVSVVGGDRVSVTTLMGAGVDPHTYKASEGDVEKIGNADIIFYSGLHLEAKLAEVFEKMGESIVTVPVAERIPVDQRIVVGTGVGAYDPHVWFDVELWSIAVESVRDTLIEIDPTHADGYNKRADAYQIELTALDSYVAEQAASVPEEQRVLITAHDAFNYFARAYNFQVLGIQGVNTATEAGAGDIQNLADFIVEHQIPAIFVESSVSPRTIEALQEAVRSRGFDVRVGGSLFSDAMGDAGTFEGTYIGMVTHNIDTIVGALAA
ncbi:MAG: zinc ABC transporter substrate-binding protein [Thermomicrobiales bacterium]|nr:zinc ABC transporter substrate-binding protein [Thermomicrobiales bacterium]